jgi:hypothetical protein
VGPFCRLMQIRLVHEGLDDPRGTPGLEWLPGVRA